MIVRGRGSRCRTGEGVDVYGVSYKFVGEGLYIVYFKLGHVLGVYPKFFGDHFCTLRQADEYELLHRTTSWWEITSKAKLAGP